ncbi:aminotransferase class V-fold PLP-dependent enzyme [uncultured Jatrophihabitans sp.]|uniref:aminotransferase class V-fold PLP-dependent enzyme n=1 Tax=uncultured Jatrophihabitans sp. TaxID=1610747 RepID=UPI0035CA8A82
MDVARVRGLYPTLATRTAHLDGSFAALQPESVIRAVIATLRSAPSQPGSRSIRSQQAAERVARARHAAADLVGARSGDVVLGSDLLSLLTRFAALAGGDWQLGDEVVLSRLDSDAAADPWLGQARARGAIVRWAEVDLETGEVPAWQYETLLGRRTRVVTVALGNPATGTVPDVRAIADLAHGHGALVVVDAGAAPPYLPIDLGELGADAVAVAAPAFGGPTVAALVTRPGLLAELAASPGHRDDPPLVETAPLPTELLDGFTAAVEHLADLAESTQGTRRERLARSLIVAGEYTRGLHRELDAGLRALPGVTVLGAAERALPVAAFTIADRTPSQVGAFLQRHEVSVWTGPAGMRELLRAVGADELGGASFVGLMAHTSSAEVRQLVEAVCRLTQ